MILYRTAQELADRAVSLLGVTARRPSDPVSATTKTSADVATRVLRKLLVIGEGDSPSASESARVTELIRPTLDALSERGIVTIADENAIPSAYFELVCDVMTFAAAPNWGKANDATLIGLATRAETILLAFSRFAKVDDLIDGFLEDLNARSIAYVPDSDAIPLDLFESLARLLSLNAASIFGQPRDETAILVVENQIKTKTASRPTFEPLRVNYF